LTNINKNEPTINQKYMGLGVSPKESNGGICIPARYKTEK